MIGKASTTHKCFNCCGLSFESKEDNPVCPNCGELTGSMIETVVYYEEDPAEEARQ